MGDQKHRPEHHREHAAAASRPTSCSCSRSRPGYSSSARYGPRSRYSSRTGGSGSRNSSRTGGSGSRDSSRPGRSGSRNGSRTCARHGTSTRYSACSGTSACSCSGPRRLWLRVRVWVLRHRYDANVNVKLTAPSWGANGKRKKVSKG